jgi:glycosyltransferase involved in cell wall biosynthesis
MVTCTVCMIAKNEGPYLLEWVSYYANLGFSKVVVFENNSDDNSAKILKKLARQGVIEHHTWPLGRTESPQITAYLECLKTVTTDWILFVDCDEFLVFNQGDLQSMLGHIHPISDVSAIALNWRVFGSSGLEAYDDRLVTERFNRAADESFEANKHLKSFLRVGKIGPNIDMHLSDVDGRIVFADGPK